MKNWVGKAGINRKRFKHDPLSARDNAEQCSRAQAESIHKFQKAREIRKRPVVHLHRPLGQVGRREGWGDRHHPDSGVTQPRPEGQEAGEGTAGDASVEVALHWYAAIKLAPETKF